MDSIADERYSPVVQMIQEGLLDIPDLDREKFRSSRLASELRGIGIGFGGAQQCEPDPTAALLAGTESGGEPVALLACASLVEPPVPGLRRVAGGGGQESVCGPRRHRNDQDRLQSSIYLKGRMKLPESV